MQHSDAPWKALKRAEDALKRLQEEHNLEIKAENWQDFLIHLERTWNKTGAYFSRSPKWSGWSSEYEHLRKKDALLSYLRHARNADEHRDDAITQPKQSGLAFNGMFGRGLFIDHMKIEDGNIVRLETKSPLVVKVVNGNVVPLAVTDRSVTYQVPDTHLDKTFEPKLEVMADLGLTFYRDALTAAEAFFVK